MAAAAGRRGNAPQVSAVEGRGHGRGFPQDIERSAKGMIGEVRFPESGDEQMDLRGGMLSDALKHIDQVVVGVDIL